jgi:uncharacterized protein (DUF2267 family)
MQYDVFVERAAEKAGIARDEAERRVKAVFSRPLEAVSWGEFQDVPEQLDPEYADFLA